MSTTVERIREQLARQDGVTAEAMEPLALAYALDVAQVNERLAVCTQLLRKGLRSEAIQQANLRPNLFDQTAYLDFPEVEEWLEILQFYQITQPRRLNRDAVQQLHEAMIEEQPLEELLRQHRRLAIAKAPLSWRLKVLRSIAALDALNGVWKDDLEIWEKARLSEIPAELNAAKQDRNFEWCSKIATELTKSHWSIQPSPDLIKAASEAAQSLEFESQCRELTEIGKLMYDCFCSHEIDQCRMHRRAWQAVSEQMKRPIPKEVYDAAEPALVWLNELDEENLAEEAHQRNVAALVRLLSSSRSLFEIQNAYRVATSAGHTLEPTLESRYRAITGELALNAKRRTIFSIVGMASVALVAAIALGVWQWRSNYKAELDSSMVALEQMLQDGKLVEAQDFLQRLETTKPTVAAAAQISALQSELGGMLQTETDRRQSFVNYIEQADNDSDALIDLGILLKAEELAISESEKEQVYRIRRRKDSYDRAQRDTEFARLNEELAAIVAQIDNMEHGNSQLIVIEDFDRQLFRLADLEDKYPLAGSEGKNLIATVRKRISSLRDAFSKAVVTKQQELRALESIRSAETLGALRLALEAFVTMFPKSSLTVEFKEASSEFAVWVKVEKWNGFAASLTDFVDHGTPQDARTLAQLLSELRNEIKLDTVLSRCPNVIEQLECVAGRPEILTELQKRLDQDTLSALVTLRGAPNGGAPDARVFAYFSEINPRRRELESITGQTGFGLNVVSDSDGTVTRASFRGSIEIWDQPKGVYEKLSTALKARQKEILGSWERQLLILVSEVMRQPDVDHTIKEILVTQLLNSATAGSLYLQQRLQGVTATLQARRPRERRWFDAQPARSDLDKELGDMLQASLGKAFRDSETSQRELAKLGDSRFSWVGVILRNAEGKAEPWILSQPALPGRLFVVRESASLQREVLFEEAGAVTKSGTNLLLSSSAILAGRPLFYLTDQ